MEIYKKYKELLAEFIALKSISTDPEFANDISATAQWLQNKFDDHEFSSSVIEGYGNPLVVASYEADPEFEWVMVYGHYDVQPAKFEDGWESDPFVLSQKDGKFVARGVVDNKGQVLIHMASVFDLIQKGALKKNVVFLIEGDEETGGPGIGRWLRENKSKYQVSHVMISDGEMPYQPVMTASFRGTFNVTIKLKTAKNSLHSGLFGGCVPNAAEELSKLIAKFNDSEYVSLVDGFFEGQEDVTDYELQLSKAMDESRKGVFAHTGIQKFFSGDKGFSHKLGFISMLTVTGMKSGYIGDGYSNIVPNTAEAKINFRIAAGSDTKKVWEVFKNFVIANVPNYVDLELDEPEELTQPVKVDVTSREHQKVMKLLEDIYGQKVLVEYCGATIPVVVDFKEVFGVDPLLVSLANDDCNMHGVNENFDIELIKKGLEFSEAYFGD